MCDCSIKNKHECSSIYAPPNTWRAKEFYTPEQAICFAWLEARTPTASLNMDLFSVPRTGVLCAHDSYPVCVAVTENQHVDTSVALQKGERFIEKYTENNEMQC